MDAAAETLLLLGGDLGDVPNTLDKARTLLSRHVGEVLATSRDHWTRPWGFVGQGLFLNRAILVRTQLPPTDLLDAVLGIETRLGRVREEGKGYASRVVDIDILLYGDAQIDRPELRIPHPLMHLRRFALAPAVDIAPGFAHPGMGKSLRQLLVELDQRPNAPDDHAL